MRQRQNNSKRNAFLEPIDNNYNFSRWSTNSILNFLFFFAPVSSRLSVHWATDKCTAEQINAHERNLNQRAHFACLLRCIRMDLHGFQSILTGKRVIHWRPRNEEKPQNRIRLNRILWLSIFVQRDEATTFAQFSSGKFAPKYVPLARSWAGRHRCIEIWSDSFGRFNWAIFSTVTLLLGVVRRLLHCSSFRLCNFALRSFGCTKRWQKGRSWSFYALLHSNNE